MCSAYSEGLVEAEPELKVDFRIRKLSFYPRDQKSGSE